MCLQVGRNRQVENAEVRKWKYGNRSTKMRRKAAYRCLSSLPHYAQKICHSPILPNVAYYAIYLHPLFHIVLSKNQIILSL